MEVIRSYPLDLADCWKNHLLKEKAIFPVKKSIRTVFSRIIGCNKHRETILKKPQFKKVLRCFDNYSGSDKRISLGLKWLLKTQIFRNKGRSPKGKTLSPFFSLFIECYKPQGTTFKGSKGAYTFCGSFKILSVTPKRWLITKTFERRPSPTMKKYVGRPSIVLSSLSNLRERFIWVHKVYWRLLCKW